MIIKRLQSTVDIVESSSPDEIERWINVESRDNYEAFVQALFEVVILDHAYKAPWSEGAESVVLTKSKEYWLEVTKRVVTKSRIEEAHHVRIETYKPRGVLVSFPLILLKHYQDRSTGEFHDYFCSM